jgi:hypothetical protein
MMMRRYGLSLPIAVQLPNGCPGTRPLVVTRLCPGGVSVRATCTTLRVM